MRLLFFAEQRSSNGPRPQQTAERYAESTGQEQASPLAGLRGLDPEALGIPNQSELMDLYRAAAGPERLIGVTGRGIAELGMGFIFFKMAVIAHGVKARLTRGVASSSSASVVSAMVPRMMALAREQINALELQDCKSLFKTDGVEDGRDDGDDHGGDEGGRNGTFEVDRSNNENSNSGDGRARTRTAGKSSDRCCRRSRPRVRAVLFDVGGVLSESPLLAIAQFEREARPRPLPPSYVGAAISGAGEDGLFQRLERGEEKLGEDFLARFAAYLCSDQAKEAYVDYATKRARGTTPRYSGIETIGERVLQDSRASSNAAAAVDEAVQAAEVLAEAKRAAAGVVSVDALSLFQCIAAASRVPVPQMIAAAESLRRGGIKIAAVSNDFLLEPGFDLSVGGGRGGWPWREGDDQGASDLLSSTGTSVNAARRATLSCGPKRQQDERAERCRRADDDEKRRDGGTTKSGNNDCYRDRSNSSSDICTGIGSACVRCGSVYSRLPSLCDVVLLSSSTGCRKPSPRIYQDACAELGVSASEAVFVDDIRANILAAEALGMRTVWVRPGGEREVHSAILQLEAFTGVKLSPERVEVMRKPAGKL